ncbi:MULTISPECIES: NAD/NADP-dependent octopine/nopaline dehydrogenase family protein [unclassified Paraburkholderia]|uniref:NAD/NADP-dependent octopine/nopaline dehydrogenase family protein n=1 Tax=unclassified Paraburkholderia TaxID=2615204 RepID=UPI00160F6EC8|nr:MULTISPECIES: NAD/NADP-dependent octopine/nopaline dehydrogenase family protein [unclassified Paraburkholderia]MBB5446942.1 opine dehydrogenase [Paraburkholderia sp. WSM4177]MBB5487406.1 opine dehydrogenase [Paraburkholderia sp. WSM4180]
MPLRFPVSIIGAGNCGCAFAADLASRGFEVLLYGNPDHRRNIDAIRANGRLLASMAITGEFYPTVTTDMAEAVDFSRFLVIAVPAYAHDDLIGDLKGFDLSRHVIIVNNANFFSPMGSRELNPQAVLETNSSPYASSVRDGEVRITGIKNCLPIAAFSNAMDEKQLSQITAIFPERLLWWDNIFAIGMQSNNGVIHPVGGILNTGWIESTKGDFFFYRDGISPSVGRVVEALDNERLKIGEAFGFRLPTVLEEMIGFYGGDCANFSDFAFQSKTHNSTKVKTPDRMQHRYICEDIPYILVPWYELGARVGIESRAIKAVIEIASSINGVNYFQTGRNLKRLGVDHMSKAELLRFVDSATFRLPLASATKK